ncbi:BREX-2 system adenine-specific DNA-methyltransferase PglX [Actinopolyspora sp. BKK1]|nr:BREX-2 system adenine-specific DNA-methyltransferase PglX [Actinopolyspora sp. BKK2]NHE77253.1 BREX-2 system adenine-specific DNA-methyltransferase PglX [Actinopolyspora sp. BKK1]
MLADLRPVLRTLEEDLREQLDKPGPERDWAERQWKKMQEAQRSAASWESYRDGLITQSAAAWVLGTVFVRWCEDNELIAPHLAGPGDRLAQAQDAELAHVRDEQHRLDTNADWIKVGFSAVAANDAGSLLFSSRHNPAYRLTPSHLAAGELIKFWRRPAEQEGRLVHEFTDPGWDTRFLGDLYQDLSENARDNYALLQTPEFIEEFILDHTLEPAVDEFGLDGFRLIDPTCGSGHFLLGAFHRLVDKWRERKPELDGATLARTALDSVHGVDLNPFAVAIARFRLLLAAWNIAGVETIAGTGSQRWSMAVAAWDSLLEPSVQDALFQQNDRENDWEDITEFSTQRLLQSGSYHVVVGNPPYINVSDPELNALYRKQYKAAYKQYQLTVPFAERFFQLAKSPAGDDRRGAGYVGQITSNAFMKREFGKRLVQEYLPSRNLTHVIDTSGAYIPGHGTPTVVLIGRNSWPVPGSYIRAVLGVQGEPGVPEDAAQGHVWRAIVDQIDQPGSESDWISVVDIVREQFGTHPWSLSGGRSAEVCSELDARPTKIKEKKKRIGFSGDTHADEIFSTKNNQQARIEAVGDIFRESPRGENARDWSIEGEIEALLYPYNQKKEKLEDIPFPIKKHYWATREQLWSRKNFNGKTYKQERRNWWEWHQLPKDEGAHSWAIAFAFVATHNHFVLDRGGKVFNRSAPVIKLPADASEEQHLELLGVLNSSTACFWLKQNCHDKGNGGIGGGIGDEAWEPRYEFTGTKLEQFPLPSELPLERSRRLDELATAQQRVTPASIAETAAPTRERLDEARAEYFRLRGRLVAEQEELDWDVYRRYGLLDEHETADVLVDDPAQVPELALGERAFEIVLARKQAAGELETSWFDRHGSTPVTELPAHWPEWYRRVVANRIELIERRRDLGLIERPECKRRWNTETRQSQEQRALRDWLLDRLENHELWYATDDNGYTQPTSRSVSELTDLLRGEETFQTVATLWAAHALGHGDARPQEIIAELVTGEHVPFLDAYRYKPSGLRKRAEWEEVWRKQRAEDRIAAEQGKDVTDPEVRKRVKSEIGEIQVPPKYAKADFLQGSYWTHRGKLDVPKERFISYPGASRASDGSLLLGWAGWDHREQAQALAVLTSERGLHDGWSAEQLTPLLAGLHQLLPWVAQWHPEIDPDFGTTPHETYRSFLDDQLNSLGLTEAELDEWKPTGRVDVNPLPKRKGKGSSA